MNLTRHIPLLPSRLLLLAAVLGLPACATRPAEYAETDPLEPVNRAVYGFNDTVDKVLLRPVARGYSNIAPRPVKTGVRNVFINLREPGNAANQLLQGKPGEAANALARFAINTTIGLLGVLDVAGDAPVYAGPEGRERRRMEEDTGQTLATWGVPAGPYLTLPLLGPSTLRDAAGLMVDMLANPVMYLEHQPMENSLVVLGVVSTRESLLSLDKTIATAQDPYAFVRSAYRQNREFQIWDGSPPVETDLYDEEFD